MFFFLPFTEILLLYILAAILPAIFLLRYIYRLDTIEKEPAYLLLRLLFCGVGAAICSILLERVGQGILDATVSQQSPHYILFLAFLVVAVVEEGMKLFFLKRCSWRDPNFDYLFDGIVYAVFTSLGFAAFENIIYVFNYGLSVSIPRAIFAIPGHLSFSVFLGIFYGRAKRCEIHGNRFGCYRNLLLGYLCAVFLHGFYDTCAMIGTAPANAIFLIFIILLYSLVYRMVRKASQYDRPIYQ